MNEDVPSVFGEWDYVHKATLVCSSCNGEGHFGSFLCGACGGQGEYNVGCGGPAAIDKNHPGLGADCAGCQCQVPIEELSHAAGN